MDEHARIVRDYYDANVQGEWNRAADKPEFLLTCRVISRYAQPGSRALDIGGGPGRYTMFLAERGCDVTLLDLSPGNVKFAEEEALRRKLKIRAVAGDARDADTLVGGSFDIILVMGPMYHLLREDERVQAMNAAIRLLKPGGVIFVSFISMFAGVIYYMKHAPDAVTDPGERGYMNAVRANASYIGLANAKAHFAPIDSIVPFMSRFPLQKLHFFGQEGITSPCETAITSQPDAVTEAWLDFAESLLEREEFLSWSEHLMYVGRKI